MKKAVLFVFLIVFSALYPASARTFAVPVLQTQRADLPWYFPEGVIVTQDPISQKIEYERYLTATDACMQSMSGSPLTIDSRSIRIKTNIKSTSSVTDPDVNMEIVLDHYIKIGDQIRITTLCKQEFRTQKEVDIVVADLIKAANEAVDIQYERQKNLTEGAIKSLADQFGVTVPELKNRLNEKDPLSGITFRELYFIPRDMKRSDFFPRELHLGYTTELFGVLGAAWLNTGVVYYNPQARILDYLTGRPWILAHEFMHTDSNLQKFPFSDGFDAELFASLPMLMPENKVNFFFHSYPSEWREIAWVFFGFDFERARKEIIRFDLGGNLIVNEAKYREYFTMLEKIKSEFNDFFPRAFENYYGNQLWWAALNDKVKDPTVVFKMMMAQNYDPTILGGRDKTMKWYLLNKDLINEVAKEALVELENGSEGDSNDFANIPDFLVGFYNRTFSIAEKDSIKSYFGKNPHMIESVRQMKAEDAFKFLKSIGQGGAR